MNSSYLPVFLSIIILTLSWGTDLRAEGGHDFGDRCFSYVIVGNGWNVDGIPNNNPISNINEAHYNSTIAQSPYNAAIYGNATKIFPLLRSYSGHIPTDYNASEIRLLTQFFLNHGIERFTGHGFFWHNFYSSAGPLVNQLNSFNGEQVRQFIDYHTNALAHLLRRPVYNVHGRQKRPILETVHPLIEAINPHQPHELRGLSPGDQNTIGSSSGSWMARANTANENYFQFIIRTAQRYFADIPVVYDDYQILDRFDGELYSRNFQPHHYKYENKAESAFFHVINSSADGAEAQLDIERPATLAQLENIVATFRETADKYAAHGKTFGLSALSVRTTVAESNNPVALEMQALAYKEIIRACMEAVNCFRVTIWGGADGDWWGEQLWNGRVAMPYSSEWNPTLQSFQPKPAQILINEYLTTQTEKRLCPRDIA